MANCTRVFERRSIMGMVYGAVRKAGMSAAAPTATHLFARLRYLNVSLVTNLSTKFMSAAAPAATQLFARLRYLNVSLATKLLY